MEELPTKYFNFWRNFELPKGFPTSPIINIREFVLKQSFANSFSYQKVVSVESPNPLVCA